MTLHRNPEYSLDDFRQYFSNSLLNWRTRDNRLIPALVVRVEDRVELDFYEELGAEQKRISVAMMELLAKGWELFSWPETGYVQVDPHVVLELNRSHARTTHKGVHANNTAVWCVNPEELSLVTKADRVVWPSHSEWFRAAAASWFRKNIPLAEGLTTIFSGKNLGVVLSPDACLILSHEDDQEEFPVLLLYQGAIARKYRSEEHFQHTGLVDEEVLTL